MYYFSNILRLKIDHLELLDVLLVGIMHSIFICFTSVHLLGQNIISNEMLNQQCGFEQLLRKSKQILKIQLVCQLKTANKNTICAKACSR